MNLQPFGAHFFNLRQQSGVRAYKLATTSLSIMLLFLTLIVFDLYRRGNASALLRTLTPPVKLQEIIPAPPVVPTVEVLLPLIDLEMGTILDKQMFELKTIPASLVSSDMLNSKESIEGKITVRKLPKGTLTLSRDVSATHENFPFDLPIGSRAVTVETNSESSVEGYAKPGSVVDVSFVFDNDKHEKTITTLVHNARVASVNGSTNPTEFIPSKGRFPLTLVVSERDAKAIRLATEAGSISLSLVGTPELVVADPRTETFSLSSLAVTAPEEKPEETFTMNPHIVRTTNENDGKEKLMITNRREASAK